MKDLVPLTLKDPCLLETRAYVDGSLVDDERKFDVFDPATGGLLAQAVDLHAAATAQAVDAAYDAGPGWAAMTGKERSAHLRRFPLPVGGKC